jgi:hypothetical protein
MGGFALGWRVRFGAFGDDRRGSDLAFALAEPIARLPVALFGVAVTGIAGIAREDQMGCVAHVAPFLNNESPCVAVPIGECANSN